MTPETIALLEKLGAPAVQIGMLALFVYYLAMTLRKQYEGRITALEERSTECERDRRAMHKEIRELQSERIDVLEGLVRKSHGEA